MEKKISLGVFAPKLTEQIPGCQPVYDELVQAWNLLRIQGVLSDSESDRVAKRIIKEATRPAAQSAQG